MNALQWWIIGGLIVVIAGLVTWRALREWDDMSDNELDKINGRG